MPVRFRPLSTTLTGMPPVIYDPNLELFLSVVEQRYSFYLGHKKIKGPQRWLMVNQHLPSNITGHAIGGVDYVLKRIALKSQSTVGESITFKLFNDDTEIYNFSVNNNQTNLHIDNIDLITPNLIDLGMSVSTNYPETNDHIDFPTVSVFVRRVYEEPPV